MLSQSFLFESGGLDHHLGGRAVPFLPSALQTLRLVVPQDSCVYARVNCAGVPRMGLAGFARMQAEQLSPFQVFGACAVKQDKTLHVWMWDKAIELDFAEKHRGRPASSVLPQALFSVPREQGVSWLRYKNQQSVSAQLWQAGKLVDSIFWPLPPSPESWASQAAQQPELAARGWPEALPPGSLVGAIALADKPWGRNLLVNPYKLPSIALLPLARAALWLVTAALAAASAAYLSERYAHQTAIAEGAISQKQRMAALEPDQQARDAAQSIGRWVQSAQALSPRPAKIDILNEAAVLLTRQGLVVRDLELNPPTVTATLVQAVGAELRLTSVIGAIEANPLFYDARFIDVVGGNAFKFTWRVRGDSAASASSLQDPVKRP